MSTSVPPSTSSESSATYTPVDRAALGHFSTVIALFKALCNESGRAKTFAGKQDLIRSFFESWRKDVGSDVYPALRLIMPYRDSRTYHMKEPMLSKALTLAINPAPSEALRLEQWKSPASGEAPGIDFADLAEQIVLARSTVSTASITVEAVNEWLDELANAGDGSATSRTTVDARARLFRRLLTQITAEELKWIVRIILSRGSFGAFRINAGDKTILPTLHPDALKIFNARPNLRELCNRLVQLGPGNSSEGIATSTHIRAGHHFSPILCARAPKNIGNVIRRMRQNREQQPGVDPENPFYCDEEQFLVEEKFDGARRSMHKVGGDYRWFSRHGTDYTKISNAQFKADITKLLHPDIIDIVLDGEVMVFDETAASYSAYNEEDQISAADWTTSRRRLCFKVFDVVYAKTIKGACAIQDLPLFRRKLFLSQVLKEKRGVVELVKTIKMRSEEEVKGMLERTLQEGGEGIVIKHPLSSYVPGERDPAAWIKLKPDYADEIGETFEALVLGGFRGTNRSFEGFASFLMGLRLSETLEEEIGPKFCAFVKVGSGFSTDDWAWIKSKTAEKWHDYDRKNPPSWLDAGSMKPDAYIMPSDSFVIEVKGSDYNRSNDYPTGVSLLFPRVKRVLKQADWTRALSVNDLLVKAGVRSTVPPHSPKRQKTEVGFVPRDSDE